MPEKLMIKNYIAETKAVEDRRALNVTITTDTVDRDGDIVEPKGIKLTNFRKNPVVLLAHDYRGLPIGRAENLERNEHGITADVIFPDEGIYPLADTVYQLYKQKFIKAWSIGFIPIKSEEIPDEDGKESHRDFFGRKGRRIKSSDLLEFSGCAVGSNPDALTNMIAKGINIEPLKEAGFIEIEEDKNKPEEVINKPEETEDYIHIPVRECEITATIDISKDEGIKALYYGKVKEIATYLFLKSKGWTMEKAKKWVAEHGKSENVVIVDDLEETKSVMPIEEEILEEEISKLIFPKSMAELIKIINENKELKEKVDKLEVDKKDLELKIGAVLNKKNKQDLKDAQERIQNVLDSAEPIEENSLEIEEVKDNKGDDTEIDIEDDAKDDKGKDEAKLEEIIEKTFKESNKSINEHFNKKIDYIMGRVK